MSHFLSLLSSDLSSFLPSLRPHCPFVEETVETLGEKRESEKTEREKGEGEGREGEKRERRKREKGRREEVVVDVGANLGQFSLYAASLGFSVFSFEPFHPNVVLMRSVSLPFESLFNHFESFC